MKGFINTVQKQVGLMVGAVGLFMVLVNLVNHIHDHGFIHALTALTVTGLFLMVLPFILSIFIEHKVFKIIQVLIMILAGILNVMQGYGLFFGPALFFAAWLLMRQYGFFENRMRLKSAILILCLIITSQISAYVNIGLQRGIYAGFSMLVFTLFLSILLLIVWGDVLRKQKMLQTENHSLKTDYNRLKKQIAEIESEKKPFDLKAVGITPAERRVIEKLTVYRASNREIAERLNIAESTVKLHLYNIYNKIGVDNRFDIIELCKYNFKET